MTHNLTAIENVDDEFLTRLCDIQSYCSSLKSTHRDDILLCREWLKKLYTSDQRDTKLRNAYLDKLWEQLKDGELKEPFDRLPKDDEPLESLTTASRVNDEIYPDAGDEVQQEVSDEIHQVISDNIHQEFSDEIYPVSQTHQVNQRHQSIQTLNDSSVENTPSENTQIRTFVSDMFNFPVTVIVHKYDEDRKNPSEQNKNILMKKSFSDGKILNTIAACHTKQSKKESQDNNSEAGDGLIFDHEVKLKLVLIEKMFDQIKINNEILGEKVQLSTDGNQFNNQISLVTDKLNRVADVLNQKISGEVVIESEEAEQFKSLTDKYSEIDDHLGQVILEIKHLKTMIEDACDNKTDINDTLEVLEYIKELHCLQITENERRFTEQIRSLEEENRRLKARVEAAKPKGLSTFNEPRANNSNQNWYIESLKNSYKRIEEYTNDRFSIIIPYLKKLENTKYQLEVLNENHRKVFSQLIAKLEEINKPSETKEMQDLISLLLQSSV
ncbi:Domain of unknown function DUF4485,Myc-type, basic helix-loop-helix (bHLH) domain [Cinara cedri]|uniref:DUF4485 domain-containing protein n=1 Tax=Cinara cedri TaxID=506608 RepID=A0A5E4M4A3_9HEMI|nr:Domain of unknown function DUF4485,Myc-type, basic helix-loop-helix (bHLH) domain [Cinara cedri]